MERASEPESDPTAGSAPADLCAARLRALRGRLLLLRLGLLLDASPSTPLCSRTVVSVAERERLCVRAAPPPAVAPPLQRAMSGLSGLLSDGAVGTRAAPWTASSLAPEVTSAAAPSAELARLQGELRDVMRARASRLAARGGGAAGGEEGGAPAGDAGQWLVGTQEELPWGVVAACVGAALRDGGCLAPAACAALSEGPSLAALIAACFEWLTAPQAELLHMLPPPAAVIVASRRARESLRGIARPTQRAAAHAALPYAVAQGCELALLIARGGCGSGEGLPADASAALSRSLALARMLSGAPLAPVSVAAEMRRLYPSHAQPLAALAAYAHAAGEEAPPRPPSAGGSRRRASASVRGGLDAEAPCDEAAQSAARAAGYSTPFALFRTTSAAERKALGLQDATTVEAMRSLRPSELMPPLSGSAATPRSGVQPARPRRAPAVGGLPPRRPFDTCAVSVGSGGEGSGAGRLLGRMLPLSSPAPWCAGGGVDTFHATTRAPSSALAAVAGTSAAIHSEEEAAARVRAEMEALVAEHLRTLTSGPIAIAHVAGNIRASQLRCDAGERAAQAPPSAAPAAITALSPLDVAEVAHVLSRLHKRGRWRSRMSPRRMPRRVSLRRATPHRRGDPASRAPGRGWGGRMQPAPRRCEAQMHSRVAWLRRWVAARAK